MPKVCKRQVYTIHKETYTFEITPDALKELERYIWTNDNPNYEKVTNITEEEVINAITNNWDMQDTRMSLIADAVNSYFWDSDYDDEYICVDDTSPWEDSVEDF